MPNITTEERGGNPNRASVYERITSAVANQIAKHGDETDPTVVAYMVARSALLQVRSRRGPGKAAQLAYKLADEFAGELG